MNKAKKFLCLMLVICITLSTGFVYAFAEGVPNGKVYISFEDYGVRAAWDDVEDLVYPNALGMIINKTEFAIYEGETIADVVTRFLTQKGIEYTYTGTGTSKGSYFYLSSIKNVTTVNGTKLDVFGEYSSGAWSGFMVRVNNCFLSDAISEYTAFDGDEIRFMNSCQGGSDVGSDYMKPSAAITGLTVDSEYGTLSPEFDADTIDYTLFVPYDVNDIKISTLQENYSAITSCILSDGVNDTVYKYGRTIPVKDGNTITFESSYYNYGETEPCDIDCVVITIQKETLEQYNERTDKNDEPSFFASLISKIKAFFVRIYNFIKGIFVK